MKAAGPKPKPKTMPPPAAAAAPAHNPQAAAAAAAAAASRASSSSSSAAAEPNPNKRSQPGSAATTSAAPSKPSDPAPSVNGDANRSPLLPPPHAPLGASPLPMSRPLLTVAAVEAVMSAIPPPPRYGLEDLDRRTVALSDGTVRTYFALPHEPPPQLRQPPPPIPPHLLVPPPAPPRLPLERWAPPPMPVPMPMPMPPLLPSAGLLPMPVPKRKWEDQANGGVPGESSGRQQQQKPEARAAKQVKVEETGVDPKALKSAFLKMVKLMNENEAHKKNYRSNGKLAQLKCPPLPGKDGQRSMQARFPASLDGLNKASRLVELFERQGHGRAAWAHIRSIAPTSDGASNNPMLVKVDGKGERTWVLYGYLATVWDLDMLDAESKQNATDEHHFCHHIRRQGSRSPSWLVRARCVCSAWRAVYTSLLCSSGSSSLRQTTPCLLYTSESAGASTAGFYSLVEKKAYMLALPDPPIRSRYIIGSSSYGWIVTSDERSAVMTQDFGHGVCLGLSELRDFLFHKAVLSADSCSGGDYFVVLIHNPHFQLSFARAGDDEWTWLPPHCDYEDCFFNRGLLYASTSIGEIHTFDLGAPVVTPKILLDRVKDKIRAVGCCKYEVQGDEEDEDDSDLELEFDPESHVTNTTAIKVHKVQPALKEFVQISSIGQNVLFLGHNQSLCLNAEEYPHLKANHVYFTDDDYLYLTGFKNNRRDIGVFDLENNTSEEIGSLRLWSNWPAP
ncbi:hypothetical protein U9M48_002168, partial [Paspalum notatum var. saurae]